MTPTRKTLTRPPGDTTHECFAYCHSRLGSQKISAEEREDGHHHEQRDDKSYGPFEDGGRGSLAMPPITYTFKPTEL